MADDRPLAAPPFEPALEALARCWNRLDPELLAPWLADGVCYESAATELYLVGREAVLEHLRRKVARIEEAGEAARMRAELGWLRSGAGRGRSCVIASQGEIGRSALFLVALTADGRIERVEVVTRDPDPWSAESSGLVP